MTSIVLAEYFTTVDNTLLFIGRHDFEEPLVKIIPLKVSEIRRFVADNFGTNADRYPKVRRLDFEQWQKQFGPLVEPLLPYAQEDDIIWFVPHDMLHYIPLHALQVDGRSLLNRYHAIYTNTSAE